MEKSESNPLARLRENVPLFFGLTDGELGTLLDASQRRILPDGRLVVTEGTLSTKLFIILAGKALVSRRHAGGTEVIATLHSGASFGEMGVVDSGPRSAQVVTQGETVVLEIDREVLEDAEPTVLVKLFRNVALIVSRRLREANRAMEGIRTHRPEAIDDPIGDTHAPRSRLAHPRPNCRLRRLGRRVHKCLGVFSDLVEFREFVCRRR